jgi:hypothetical protein
VRSYNYNIAIIPAKKYGSSQWRMKCIIVCIIRDREEEFMQDFGMRMDWKEATRKKHMYIGG